MNDSYTKSTITSVTNFLHCGDQYLFLHRDATLAINPSQLNGVGGKLEPGEDYIGCAIRETAEETGYIISEKDIRFSGLIKFESKERENWVTCFFKIEVPSLEIPLGNSIPEGELLWLRKDDVLSSQYHLVDDINYIWHDIISGEKTFFINAQTEGDEYRIDSLVTHYLS
ncbi:NUDIX domain-containing protein [Candidatus Roizmanbacteria bacterium]|nr:NUDIX domain-containing protein [Candidatus Roizmanbacteria bacterium]